MSLPPEDRGAELRALFFESASELLQFFNEVGLELEARPMDEGAIRRVRLTPEGASARNIGFDVTPARYVTALITERGICAANESALQSLFPDLDRDL